MNKSVPTLKKAFSIIVVITILASALNWLVLSQPVHAACAHYDSCSQQTFFFGTEEELRSLGFPTGTKPYITLSGSNKLYINLKLWHDKGLVVYGETFGDFKPATQYYDGGGKRIVEENKGYYSGTHPSTGSPSYGEYRYHGYTATGNPFTNQNFPDDANSGRALSDKKWAYRPWTTGLADEPHALNIYASQYNHQKTQDWINEAIKFNVNGGVADKYNYALILSPPSPYAPSEYRMWHAGTNKDWYQTMSGKKIDKAIPTLEVSYEILTPPEKLQYAMDTAGVDNTPITVDVLLKAHLKDEETFGHEAEEVLNYNRKDIDRWELKLTQRAKTQSYSINNRTANRIEQTAAVNLTLGEVKALVNNSLRFDYEANVYFLCPTGEDKSTANTDFTVKFTPCATPYAQLKLTATVEQPRDEINKRKISSASDQTVQLKAEATVHNVEADEVKEWRFFAAFLDTPGDYLQITLPGNSTSKTHTFNFTVPADKICPSGFDNFDYYIQNFKSTAYAVLKKGKNNITNVQASGSTSAEFYKAAPPQPTPSPGGPTPEPAPTPSPKPPPVLIHTDVIIPRPAFDIVPYCPIDNTDMSKVASKTLYINGQQVDYDHFFSGNYVFGLGNDGMKKIDIFYISTDGHEASFSSWLYVYDTKPIANLKLSGSFKENRRMTVEDVSTTGNIQLVVQQFPIIDYDISITTVDVPGSSLKVNEISRSFEEFTCKTVGTYKATLRVKNTLNRWSDPYEVEFSIHEDHPAAVICNLYNSSLARNETIGAYAYEAVSTDGDSIASNTVQLYYDSDNNGTYNQLLKTWNNVVEFPSYTPTKLGAYKFVNTVVENIEGDVIPAHISAADRKVKVIEREFLVDNYIPMTGVYVDIPIIRPEVDAYFMLDRNLNSTKKTWVLNNRMNINNSMRAYNMLAKVENWDMKTYTYYQSASTTEHTGSSYPSSSTYYSSGDYSGTLYLYDVTNNRYSRDEGKEVQKTEQKTFYDTLTNVCTTEYDADGKLVSQEYSLGGNDNGSGGITINEDGYYGTLSLDSYDSSTQRYDHDDGSYTTVTTFTGYFSGTLSKTIWVWEPKIVWYDDYYGHYDGEISKSVRQPYTNPFRTTSYKYVVYVSDGNVSELWDLQNVMSKSDAKLILIGQNSIKTQIDHDYFILNNKPIDQLINDAVAHMSDENKAVEKYYILAGQGTFNLSVSDYDEENDPIIETKFQYVQNQNYFDNSNGKESFAVSSYSEDSGWVDTKASTFSKVGEYHIYRRIKDRPSTDPNFAQYSYYSGTPELIVYAHRKPIANATLVWDYDVSKNVYKTTWEDKSYDLDHQHSRPDKGIVEKKIMFRRNYGEWLYYIPDELTAGTYELQYYVKDVEGVWSDVFTMNFTLATAPPVQFDASLRTLSSSFSLYGIPASEYLQVYDAWTRYPYNIRLETALYNGAARVSPLLQTNFSGSTGTKSGNDIYWNNISYQVPATLADGMYTCRISAMDVNNTVRWADKSFTVTVNTPINLVPAMPEEIFTESSCSIQASTSKYVNTLQVTLYAGTAYQTVINLTGSASGNGKSWIINYNVPAGIPDGNYTARFRAAAPNGTYETRDVQFSVESLKINGVSIQGRVNHWRGQRDIFDKLMKNEPHRFLSLETVAVSITTQNADTVTVRFSPELESMQFTDKYGHAYDMEQDFQIPYTYFPGDSTFSMSPGVSQSINWEYQLPLARSTVNWEDERRHPSYWMTVTAWKGTKSVSHTISDIDITGNIYDLVYIQPLN